MHTKKRTVMVFPEFGNIKYIDEIREKYDPLAGKVRPHITLVFPFESALQENDISTALDRRLHGIKPFVIKLKGLAVSGHWLSLNVVDGAEELAEIHKVLYENEFADYKPVWLNRYIPHITVGQFPTVAEAQKAYGEEQEFNEVFSCLVDKISVEIIGENEESIIESDYYLAK